MKKLLVLSCLAALVACGMPAQEATKDCNSLGYKPGTPDYDHCMVDMKQANKLQSQNKAKIQ